MGEQVEDRKRAKGQLYIIGIGMGDSRSLTVEAQEAVGASELIVGAERVITPFENSKRCEAASRTDDIVKILEKECTGAAAVRTVAVLMSGDSGFFSGTKQLIAALDVSERKIYCPENGPCYTVSVLAGVSSLSYFCARIGKSWEDVKVVNLHGADENLWQAVLTHEKVFAVTGGDVQSHFKCLVEKGMGDTVSGYVGEKLSYDEERITYGTAAQLAEHTYDRLAVLYLENPYAVGQNLTGLPDDSFVRGKTPMTKAEVRAAVMSRLRIRDKDIVYDIGAGTGSVTVEMALSASKGKVFAIENNAEAIELCKLNVERFGLYNVKIVEGTAPDVLSKLPAPDVVFIGGSKGRLEEIIACLIEKNPALRLVVNTITVENTERALQLLDNDVFLDAEAVQIQVNRIKKAGDGHLVTALNPVTIVSARGRGKDRTGSISQAGTKAVLVAGNGSGSGKTVFVCGLLNILRRRGINPCAFKCGPDYIDPSFHRKASGAACYNIDPFFTAENTLRKIYEKHTQSYDISVIEGVMGYYDGLGFTEEAGTYAVAQALQVPVILLVDCKGMGSSVMATVEGFLRHRQPSYIKGVIFNRLSSTLYEQAAQAARRLGLVPLGYLPEAEELRLDSRHLGLVMAEEIQDFEAAAGRIADVVERTVDVDGILQMADAAKNKITDVIEEDAALTTAEQRQITDRQEGCVNQLSCRIAVAQDEAFCFMYEDNLNFLEEHGARIIPFSPLHDSALPACDAIYLSGGYPELYAEELSGNHAMRREIKDKITGGMPTIAECGGFLYLHERMEAEDGSFRPMAGVIGADAVNGRRKGRFGYIEVTLKQDCVLGNAGDRFRAHEFHYWESEAQGENLSVFKPGSGASWQEGICTDTMYAGFPHLYFYGSPKVGESFVRAACEYARTHICNKCM